MITSETLKSMMDGLRSRFNTFTESEREALVNTYRAKIEILTELMEISKEADKDNEH